MFEFNQDWKRRDDIVFADNPPKWDGNRERYDILHFDNLSANQLQKLVDEKFADPADRQNSAPTLGQFLEFMKPYSYSGAIKAIGYVVSHDREDYRVTIEGLSCKGIGSETLVCKLVDTFRHADEFSIKFNDKKEGFDIRCWYD